MKDELRQSKIKIHERNNIINNYTSDQRNTSLAHKLTLQNYETELTQIKGKT